MNEQTHGEHANMAGKRCTKKVPPVEGAISWETAADAGEVDHDDDEDLANLSNSVVNKNIFQRMNLEEPLNSSKYDICEKHIKKLPNGFDLTVKKFQMEGFTQPFCILDKEGLGMKLPEAKSFGIGEVRSAVGSRRLLDVMNVNSEWFLFMYLLYVSN